MAKPLPLSFYRRPTKLVAKELLGQRLVRILPNGKQLSGLIVETEAYLGIKDRACHTYGGRRTPRVEPMYLSGGHSYVYLIYGMYHCFNVVTCKKNEPEAVLIRAIIPEFTNDVPIGAGPGKLCRALKIDLSLNSHLLNSSPLWVEEGVSISQKSIRALPRIGVDYAGAHAKLPLRFFIPSLQSCKIL